MVVVIVMSLMVWVLGVGVNVGNEWSSTSDSDMCPTLACGNTKPHTQLPTTNDTQ